MLHNKYLEYMFLTYSREITLTILYKKYVFKLDSAIKNVLHFPLSSRRVTLKILDEIIWFVNLTEYN